ncbi:hypothetical protein ABH994_005557 [Bradyrhizobium yuanmingense]|uniref:hypothetical protein n=1 Tax=Bradyrhizobium yuanmingense TaxID=108015 RepID=UPI003516D2B8
MVAPHSASVNVRRRGDITRDGFDRDMSFRESDRPLIQMPAGMAAVIDIWGDTATTADRRSLASRGATFAGARKEERGAITPADPIEAKKPPLPAFELWQGSATIRKITESRAASMSTERVFNIFMYFVEGRATEYGVRHHRLGGSEKEKGDFLLSRVEQDHSIARRFRLSRSFTPEEWLAVHRYGQALEYFEEAFVLFRASAAPVYCITPIVDGAPKIDKQIGPEPYRGDAVTHQDGLGNMPDYLVEYTSENGLRFTDLIHDDYFKGIRTLFNAKLYVSCSKLLMSCVDTLAFVEYGDVSGNFSKWVTVYVDLKPLGISADELWEFRNSLLHMTTLSSRKVIAGKVSPIMPCVGNAGFIRPLTRSNAPKPFDLFGLIKAIGHGIGKWGEGYNTDRDKLLKFIERYDTTISDSRVGKLSTTGPAGAALAGVGSVE